MGPCSGRAGGAEPGWAFGWDLRTRADGTVFAGSFLRVWPEGTHLSAQLTTSANWCPRTGHCEAIGRHTSIYVWIPPWIPTGIPS